MIGSAGSIWNPARMTSIEAGEILVEHNVDNDKKRRHGSELIH